MSWARWKPRPFINYYLLWESWKSQWGDPTSRGGRHFWLNKFHMRPIVFNKRSNNFAFFLIRVIYFPSASSLPQSNKKGVGVEKVHRWRRFNKRRTKLGVCLIILLYLWRTFEAVNKSGLDAAFPFSVWAAVNGYVQLSRSISVLWKNSDGRQIHFCNALPSAKQMCADRIPILLVYTSSAGKGCTHPYLKHLLRSSIKNIQTFHDCQARLQTE